MMLLLVLCVLHHLSMNNGIGMIVVIPHFSVKNLQGDALFPSATYIPSCSLLLSMFALHMICMYASVSPDRICKMSHTCLPHLNKPFLTPFDVSYT